MSVPVEDVIRMFEQVYAGRLDDLFRDMRMSTPQPIPTPAALAARTAGSHIFRGRLLCAHEWAYVRKHAVICDLVDVEE